MVYMSSLGKCVVGSIGVFLACCYFLGLVVTAIIYGVGLACFFGACLWDTLVEVKQEDTFSQRGEC